jgi:hypothetical protein
MSHKLILTLLSIILSFPTLNVFADDITRSCTASYNLHIHNRYGTFLRNTEMYSFTAKGTCGGAVPNKCRKRARAAAKHCMDYHVNNDYNTTYPNADNLQWPYYCSSHKNIRGYHIENFREKLYATTCGSNTTDKYKVIIGAKIRGKTGCKNNTEILRHVQNNRRWFIVDCSLQR